MNYRPVLDKVRWMSAVLVALGHALGILNDHVQGSRVLNFIADMRSPAVLIFFVLSGYLVGGLVMRDFQHFDLRRYAIARFSRIYIVLIPALLLTVLVDGAVYHFDSGNPLFSRVWQGGALGSVPVFSRYTLDDAIASLFCLEPLLGRAIGSAGSLWSLGDEWIYYFAFPAIFALGYRFGRLRGTAVLAFASVGALYLVSKNEAGFWLVWLAGAYANAVDPARLLRSEPARRAVKYAALAACLTAVILGSRLTRQGCLVIIAAAGFVVLAFGPAGEGHVSHAVDKALARFSYSLYVTHMQIMTLLGAILFRLQILPLAGIRSPAAVVGLALGMLGLCAAVAYSMAALFEDRTHALARWLNGTLPRFSMGPALPAALPDRRNDT